MDSNLQQRALASLTIYSRTLSAKDLAQLVPFPPERSRQKGTPRGRQPGNVHPHSVVAFESHVDRSASLGAHLDDLLGRLDPARPALHTFAQRARSEGFQSALGRPFAPIVLWLYIYARNPEGPIGLNISNDQLKTIFDLGADLAVEFETYEEDSRQPGGAREGS
jgi:Domain of unknown function (DUF4279)